MGISGQIKSINMDLKREIERLSGEKLDACYLCGKCSAGCPAAPYQDIPPHVVVRMAQLGNEEVLRSKMIWNCVSCGTCYTRCPNEVNPSKICETLSQIAKRKGIISDKVAATLREKFIESVKGKGRIHELALGVQMKLASGDLFSDFDIAVPMFFQGKLPVSSHRIKDIENFQKLFKQNGKKGDK